MITYLASPIDRANTDPGFAVMRSRLRDWLVAESAAVYDPAGAWSIEPLKALDQTLDALSEINFRALDSADLVVALAPLGVPTVGVPIEVYHALTLTDSRVALWFGEADGLGAMWTHIIEAFSTRVYVLPGVFDRDDVHSMFNWVRTPEEMMT